MAGGYGIDLVLQPLLLTSDNTRPRALTLNLALRALVKNQVQ